MGEPRRFRSPLVRELATLEMRRTASGALVLMALVVIAFVTGIDWKSPAAGLLDESELAAKRGLQRVSGWTVTLTLLLPALVLHASGIARRWRAGEADWLGASPRSRACVLVSTWIGTACGAATLVLAAAAVVELRSSAGAATTRAFAHHDLADYLRVEPGTAAVGTFRFARWPAGSRLRARVHPSPGGAPTTDARVTVRVGGVASSRDLRVASRTWIEVDLPAAPGGRYVEVEIEIEVANLGDGALTLVTPGTFELSIPAASERLGSWSLFTRTLCALACVSALALGLGAWVGSGSAALLALLAWLAPAIWLGGPTWWPGGDLARVLELVGEGRVPETFDLRSIVAAALVCGAALACGRAGLRSWRFAR